MEAATFVKNLFVIMLCVIFKKLILMLFTDKDLFFYWVLKMNNYGRL